MTEEAIMGAQAGEKVTISRGYNCEITSFNISLIRLFDVEAKAITLFLDSVYFINCFKSGPYSPKLIFIECILFWGHVRVTLGPCLVWHNFTSRPARAKKV